MQLLSHLWGDTLRLYKYSTPHQNSPLNIAVTNGSCMVELLLLWLQNDNFSTLALYTFNSCTWDSMRMNCYSSIFICFLISYWCELTNSYFFPIVFILLFKLYLFWTVGVPSNVFMICLHHFFDNLLFFWYNKTF